MYTRCPSCRAEISFEPPANAASLPEGYKHRIKCPSCGVTIGVKIPRVDAMATVQPTFTPVNPNATAFEPVYTANEAMPAMDFSAAGTKVKPAKKHGTARNVIMLIISLIFVAASVVGYLIAKDIISIGSESMLWANSFKIVDGISGWEQLCTNFAEFSAGFKSDALLSFLSIIPMILFSLACINVIVSVVSLIGKKYGRAYNVVMSTLMGACACIVLFLPLFVIAELAGVDVSKIALGDYFKETIINGQQYLLIAVAALGLIQFILSLCFIKSLKIKRKD